MPSPRRALRPQRMPARGPKHKRMAPDHSRTQGWRAGILAFFAVALFAPLLLFSRAGDSRAVYGVYALIVGAMVLAWLAYAFMRRRVRRREA
jgi:predicted permease